MMQILSLEFNVLSIFTRMNSDEREDFCKLCLLMDSPEPIVDFGAQVIPGS